MKRILLAFASTALLASCASTQVQSTLDSLKDLPRSISNASARKAGTSKVEGTSLTQTPLLGVLREELSSDGRAPEWPKVVITDLRIPADQTDPGHSYSLKPDECIWFNAVLWRDAKRSENFNGLHLCAEELPKQSNNFVVTWHSFPISGKTSGQIRTDGPTPPYAKLPGDAFIDRWLMNQIGLYYIGSLLTLVGYDPHFIEDDRRFWVKNAAQVNH